MSVEWNWEGYKPEGYKGLATWRVDGYTQSAEFPTFTHAHAINNLVNEAYKAGRRDGIESATNYVQNALAEVKP